MLMLYSLYRFSYNKILNGKSTNLGKFDSLEPSFLRNAANVLICHGNNTGQNKSLAFQGPFPALLSTVCAVNALLNFGEINVGKVEMEIFVFL